MAKSLTWLGPVLRGAGLKVAEEFGWENRGLGDVGETFGVICHHTGNAAPGVLPTKDVLIHGRSDLRGPLAQLGLGRDGTYFLIAAGLAQHAGKGSFRGITSGNTHFIGIEAEHSGSTKDPWPAVQLEAYHRGVAAILGHIGRGSEWCIAHREWAPNRKSDPVNIKMTEFRAAVADILNGTAPPPVLIPRKEPTGQGRPTLRRGADDPLVVTLQNKLRITPTSTHFGPKTEAAVREFQRSKGMVPDGIVGPKTWAALDSL